MLGTEFGSATEQQVLLTAVLPLQPRDLVLNFTRSVQCGEAALRKGDRWVSFCDFISSSTECYYGASTEDPVVSRTTFGSVLCDSLMLILSFCPCRWMIVRMGPELRGPLDSSLSSYVTEIGL